jgi:hypothetical protein
MFSAWAHVAVVRRRLVLDLLQAADERAGVRAHADTRRDARRPEERRGRGACREADSRADRRTLRGPRVRVMRAGRRGMIAARDDAVVLARGIDAERADVVDVHAGILQPANRVFRIRERLESAGDDRAHLMPPPLRERLQNRS